MITEDCAQDDTNGSSVEKKVSSTFVSASSSVVVEKGPAAIYFVETTRHAEMECSKW